MKGILVLEDGTLYRGRGVGAGGATFGEIVFNTSLTGYQEVLTDPSYRRQILLMTTPQIGNYGIQEGVSESRGCFLAGFVVRQLSPIASHWCAGQSLGCFLREQGVVAVEGVDTRDITRRIRQAGSMKAGIFAGQDKSLEEMLERVRAQPPIEERELVSEVSCEADYLFSRKHGMQVALIDCGAKKGIMRELAARNGQVRVWPASVDAQTVLRTRPDGVVISNGPGDPQAVEHVIDLARALIGRLPILGICLGHQILGLALGGRTYKLKFGHHGSNHPVANLQSGRVEITSQNHNFSLDEASLSAQQETAIEITHRSLFDGSLEGFTAPELKVISVQFHPEASPGPHDASYLFDDFFTLMTSHRLEKQAKPGRERERDQGPCFARR